MPLTEDNNLLNLLVESVAIIPLNIIEFNRLSIAALQYLLSYTYEKGKLFATPEYEVFRYSAILAAKEVSDDAYKTLVEQLPTSDQIENSIHGIESKFITDHQKVVKELEPLIEFIDFKRIKPQILVDFVEPLKIIPTEIISSVYQHKALLNHSNLNDIRGMPVFDIVWDKSECGSELIIEELYAHQMTLTPLMNTIKVLELR